MDKNLEERLREIEARLDMVQGDVNIIATLNKERDRDLAEELVSRRFGRSDNKRLCWYYADNERTISDISEETGIRERNVRTHLAELNDDGLLTKREEAGNTYYRKAKMTTGLGIESQVEDYVDEL
jgi:DNA-binding transcriptional ArsR family regulator